MKNRLPLFYLVTVLFWMALYTYVPYVTPYAEVMEADLRFIGIIAGAYGFVQMALRFPLGIFSDRIGKRKIFILMGLLFAGLSGLVVYFFPSPVSLLISRSFAGVTAATWVTLTILGSSYYKPEETVKSIGILNAANGFGRMSALLIGGFIAEQFGFSYAFLLGGAVGILGLVLGLGMVEKAPKPDAPPPPNLAALLDVARNPQLLSASLLAIIGQFIQFGTAFGFTPIVAVQMGASNFQLGLLGMMSTLPAVIISPFMGTFVKKIGVLSVLLILSAFTALGTALVVVSNSLYTLFFVQFISSVGLAGLMTVLMGLSIRDIEAERRATAMGFFQAVYGIGMFLGPFVVGWVGHSFGLMTAFLVAGGVGAFGMLASLFCVKKGYLAA